jgi:hypothetical protein
MTAEEAYETVTRNLSPDEQQRLMRMLQRSGGAADAELDYDDVWTDEDLRALSHATLRYAEEQYGPADDLV